MANNLLTWFFPYFNKVKKVVDPDKSEQRLKEEEPVELEKGDLKAMIIAGFLVFGPFVLLVAIMMVVIILLL